MDDEKWVLSLLFKSVKVSGACEDVRKHVKMSEKMLWGVKLCQKVSDSYDGSMWS